MLRSRFEEWYAQMIVAQMGTGFNLNHVTINCNLLLAMIRDTHAKWIIENYQELCSAESCKTLIINGFEKCVILGAFDDSSVKDNPFHNLMQF